MDTVESVVSVHCVDVRQSLSQLGTLGSILREASYRPSSSITELLSSKYSAAWKTNRVSVSYWIWFFNTTMAQFSFDIPKQCYRRTILGSTNNLSVNSYLKKTFLVWKTFSKSKKTFFFFSLENNLFVKCEVSSWNHQFKLRTN